MRVNHKRFELTRLRIVTAASPTINGRVPRVQVVPRVHGRFGICHGSMTPLHGLL